MSNDSAWRRSEVFPEPDREDIDLVTVLKAIADPARLTIIRTLADDEYHTCTVEEYGLALHKSTLSHHLKALREAGITATRVTGREHAVKLRRDDLDARCPGLLTGILSAAAHTRSDQGSLRTPNRPHQKVVRPV